MFTLFFIPHQNISREARTTWCHYPTNPQPLPRFAQKKRAQCVYFNHFVYRKPKETYFSTIRLFLKKNNTFLETFL